MAGAELDHLIYLLSRLPGLGPRSARRSALHLIRQPETLMAPLATALQVAAKTIGACTICGNLDSRDPCDICQDPGREDHIICVVEDVGDLWALERAGSFKGRYHLLGGVLSAIDGVAPEDLNIGDLITRAADAKIREVILATNATVDGQTTAHYLKERLTDCAVEITRLAHGVPVGGELDFLDDGTLSAAMNARRPL